MTISYRRTGLAVFEKYDGGVQRRTDERSGQIRAFMTKRWSSLIRYTCYHDLIGPLLQNNVLIDQHPHAQALELGDPLVGYSWFPGIAMTRKGAVSLLNGATSFFRASTVPSTRSP